ncbi:MAG: hypothetical protein M3Z04_11460, partial [Chloroflexota bacterium]|nr:hypothetical protein [Chloroflexota bacterium]
MPPATLGDQQIRRWVAFGRLLRRNGVVLTAGQVRDLLQVLGEPTWDWSDRETMYLVARSLLCGHHDDWPRFDVIFRQFWGRTRQMIIPSDSAAPRPETQGDSSAPPLGGQTTKPDAPPVTVERWTAFDAPDTAGSLLDDAPPPERVLLYSADEVLRRRDFADFTDEEISHARALMAGWRWQPGERRTRRLAAARRGRRLHIGPT